MESFWKGFEKQANNITFRKLDDSNVKADFTYKWAAEAMGLSERKTSETVPHSPNYFNDITNRIPKDWYLLKGRMRGT